ncbi:transglycosylase [Neobacillus bataviensis LMG 21833]|uniref:Transglycosylase n=1 Tax=Neobacillus bataviensis LMG 21833 TaxID=1117379 RepID=K6C6P6_9BACI|nr:transglycosylase [Neobacillus bataviensis]EKN66820.1 transglycosylase [Neobacillus bataviensis LMG 21833]
MKLSKVAISTGLVASFMMTAGEIAHADTPKSTHEVAIEVINGNYGNGDARVTNLKTKGFDVKAIQTEVNNILTGTTTQVSATAKTTEEQPTKVTSAAPAQAAESVSGGLNMSQTSGQIDIQAP